MSNDNKRLVKTIIISGLSAVISYLINFFLTSYISENVGIDAYGFVAIAKTAVSYAQIITVALTTFIVFNDGMCNIIRYHLSFCNNNNHKA
mgnify:CR=1 FL=1